MYICLGGTFWPLHRGHDHLLSTAIAGATRLRIGLTSDESAGASKDREVAGYVEREEGLRGRLTALMAEAGKDIPFDIAPLDGELSTAEHMAEVEGIVLSRDMEGNVERLQALRKEAGQRPFEVIFAEELLAADGLPLRASRVAAGELNADGSIAGTLRVAVGTANQTKVTAVREVLSSLYPENDVEVKGVEVESGVPDQPWDAQVMAGAVNRARAAMEAEADEERPHLSVGIEAGLLRSAGAGRVPGAVWGGGTPDAEPGPPAGSPIFDVQYCAVADRGGRVTHGHGPGFVYPDELLREVEGGKQVREVMLERYWSDESQRKGGAVRTFSRGHMDRLELTRQAVLMAMIPRVSGLHGP